MRSDRDCDLVENIIDGIEELLKTVKFRIVTNNVFETNCL